jgi:hypothetical protein
LPRRAGLVNTHGIPEVKGYLPRVPYLGIAIGLILYQGVAIVVKIIKELIEPFPQGSQRNEAIDDMLMGRESKPVLTRGRACDASVIHEAHVEVLGLVRLTLRAVVNSSTTGTELTTKRIEMRC